MGEFDSGGSDLFGAEYLMAEAVKRQAKTSLGTKPLSVAAKKACSQRLPAVKGYFLNDGFSEWQGSIWRGCSEPGPGTLLWGARR